MRIGRKVGLLVGGLLLVDVATLGASGGLLLRAQTQYNAFSQASINDVAAANSIKDAYQEQNYAWDQLVINAQRPKQAGQSKQATQRDAVASLYDDLATNAYRVEALTAQLSKSDNPALRSAALNFGDIHRLITPEQLASIPKVLRGTYTTPPMTTIRQAAAVRAAGRPLEAVNTATQQSLANERALERRLMTAFAIAAVALVLALSTVAALMTRRIVGPIQRMIDSAIDAADRRLPQAVSTVRSQEGEVEAPHVARFKTQTKDELEQLAGALNRMQDSTVEMAVDVRRAELRHAETLVNLGRRNQSMLTRTLAYVAELEREEKDSDTLAKLFRLDHLATRVRRNAESMLVLAGAQQSRVHSRPVPVANLVRASLAEIEDYNRVDVVNLEPVAFLGAGAADTTHLLAELMENATHFSPDESRVSVSGRRQDDGYVFTIRDVGLGMTPQELAAANTRLSGTGAHATIEDTKMLGHHIVARISARRGIHVQLEPGSPSGVTATVEVPRHLLVDPAANSPEQRQAVAHQSAGTEQDKMQPKDELQQEIKPLRKGASPAAAESPNEAIESPNEVTLKKKVTLQNETETPAGVRSQNGLESGNRLSVVQNAVTEVSSFESTPASTQPSPAVPQPSPAVPQPSLAAVSGEPGRDQPRRRVRGASLANLADETEGLTAVPRDPEAVRAAFSGLQGGVRNAQNEIAVTREFPMDEAEQVVTSGASEPMSGPVGQEPVISMGEVTRSGLRKRVRGAQLPGRESGLPVSQEPQVGPVEALSAVERHAAISKEQAQGAQGSTPTSASVDEPRSLSNSASDLPRRPGLRRRIRGAQLPDLGDNDLPQAGVPRDAGRVRSQMANLQASVAKARRDAGSAAADADLPVGPRESADIEEK